MEGKGAEEGEVEWNLRVWVCQYQKGAAPHALCISYGAVADILYATAYF